MRPISLRLLARQYLEAKEGFPFGWAQTRHHAPQLDDRSGVAAPFEHLIQASRSQARILLERLLDEVKIRIGQARAQAAPLVEAMRLDGPLHRLRMQVELGGDGADLPMLGKKESANFGGHLSTDHFSLQFGERIDPTPRPAAKVTSDDPPRTD